MNKDQAMSAFRSLMKIVGGVLAANGINKTSVTQIVLGIVSAIVGLVLSHIDNATPPVTPPTAAKANPGRSPGDIT